MPKVSVVVPLYNKGPYVKRALDSIAGQTVRDFEALIVDDGSTDNGPAVVSSFDDARFRLIRQPNAGPGAARNRGIREAAGEFIAFLDADDQWLPVHLEKALAALESEPAASIFACSYFHCPGEHSTEPMWRKRGITGGLQRVRPDTPTGLFVQMLAFMMPPQLVGYASLFRKYGGFYERDGCRYGEDAFMLLKILLNETVFFDLEPRARIFKDAAALSKNLKRARPLEPFLAHPEEIEAHCPPELRPLLARFYAARAFKTACVWSYWGKWREARDLRERFRTPGDRNLNLYWTSKLCATPAGAAAGSLARKLGLALG